MTTKQLGHGQAYAIREDLGGGYRGAIKVVGGEQYDSERFGTMSEAQSWVKRKLCECLPRHTLARRGRGPSYVVIAWSIPIQGDA